MQLNQVRSQNGLAALHRVDSAALRRAACKPDISASAARNYLPGPGSIVVFTQSDTNSLPTVLKKSAGDPLAEDIAIGVCYPPASQQGFAMFTAYCVRAD